MQVTKYISWFRDIGLDDRPKVGGKGGSLGELHRAGINVPPGFVVRTEAFEGFIDTLERRSPVRASMSGPRSRRRRIIRCCSSTTCWRARTRPA